MLAQMAEKDVLQARMIEFADGIGTFVIAEVSVSLAYTHLELMGIRTGYEHIHIIIRFHHHCISLAGILESLIGHTPQVSHNHELAVACSYVVADRLGRIMRHHEILYPEPVDVVPRILLEFTSALT